MGSLSSVGWPSAIRRDDPDRTLTTQAPSSTTHRSGRTNRSGAAMQSNRLDTQQKAVAINLDHTKYGTFAEIGAGQEVARWFFRVGGAAGTIAKSISAYDMTVSDAMYGPCARYVSRPRLETMLESEYRQTTEHL